MTTVQSSTPCMRMSGSCARDAGTRANVFEYGEVKKENKMKNFPHICRSVETQVVRKQREKCIS